jgi:DNA-binding NtrC family response regulator
MKPSILIVESNNALLQLYREWLWLIGYSVHTADTTLAAEEKLDIQRYHVVIYDIDAAGSNGIDFLREFWLQFKIGGTQVAVISRDDKFRATCEAMGIAFFPRPIRTKDLEHIVGNLLYGDLRPVATRPLPVLA